MPAASHPQPDRTTAVEPADVRRAIGPAVVVLVVAVTFVALFVAAFHDPKPNGVKVALVAPPQLQERLEQQIARAGVGTFDFERAPSPRAARQAVLDGDVQGALITGGPGRQQLLVADAGSFMVAQAIEGVFTRAASAAGTELAVEDVRPLPSGDSRGLSVVFLAFGTAVPSFVLGLLLWVVGGGVRARAIAGVLVGYGVAVGLLAALTADTVIGAVDGEFWAVSGLLALLSLAVAAAVAGLGRLLGPAGIGLAVLVLMLLAQSSSGGPVGPLMLPDFYKAISQLLPTGAAITALRDVVYFDGQQSLAPLIVLACWALGGLAAIAVGRRRVRIG